MKLIIFDMDGTLTPSRSPIDPVMRAALEELPLPYAVISGAAEKQIRTQIPIPGMIALGQNGNEYFGRKLANADVAIIRKHIDTLRSAFPLAVQDPEDLVEERGSQVSFSLLGHHEDLDRKRSFDPKGILRRALLEMYPFRAEGLSVMIGGTTCYDYTGLGWNKAENIRAYAREKEVDLNDVVYFGDQFYEGGNDEAVRSVCAIVEVKDWQETLRRLAV